MAAILFGLAAAAFIALGTLSASRATRSMGPWSTLAGVMAVGLVVVGPLAAIEGVPSVLTGSNIGLWLMAGIGNVGGLLLVYTALRIGKVGVVAPIISAEGAIAAVIAAVAGESIAPLEALILLAIVVGVGIAVVAPDPAPIEHERPIVAALCATAAALLFGVSLFSMGQLSGDIPTSWILLSPRLLGVVVIALPLVLSRRLAITRQGLPYIIATGLAEVLGLAAFTLGAQTSIALTSVLMATYAPLAAIAAFFLFREKLGRIQIAAVGLIGVSVVALAFVTNS